MKYLITGATGFMGPHLVRRLLADGHPCRCLVRDKSRGQALADLGAEIVPGDITEAQTLEGIGDGMDRLLHLATLGHANHFSVTPEMFEQVNVGGTLNILQEALRADIPRIVHCSSVAAVGIAGEVPTTEESACHPHHPYGQSKLKAEQVVERMVAEANLPATIVRFSMVYGPGDWRDMLKLTRIAKKGLWPKIGSRPKLSPLIHVEDAIQGLLLAAEKGRFGEIYFITNERSEPFDKLRIIIQRALGVRRVPLYVPEWLTLALASAMEKSFPLIGKVPPVTRKNIESTLADRVFSIAKAQKELGFKPRIDPEEGLHETVRWYRKEGWLKRTP